MKTVAPSRLYEFTIEHPDNMIRVEVWEEKVVARAALDTFSEQRKATFIRHLAAEGFVPDRYEWYSGSESSGYSGVIWLIDRSWLSDTPAQMRLKATPWIAGMFAASGVLLVVIMEVIVALAR